MSVSIFSFYLTGRTHRSVSSSLPPRLLSSFHVLYVSSLSTRSATISHGELALLCLESLSMFLVVESDVANTRFAGR